MKRFLTIFLFIVLCCTYASAQRGSIVTDTVASIILGVDKPFTVYLPAGYNDADKDYPVLYLLHGAWGGHEDWNKKGNAQRIADAVFNAGMAVPVIIVMPDASGENPDKAGYRMGYFDKEGWQYEQHFFTEFIPFVEGKYRIRAEKKYRAVSGLSMGGGGSMVYGLRHPELFGSCCPLSGLLSGRQIPALSVKDESFNSTVISNDPQTLIREADDETLDSFRTVRWYIDCGDDDYLAVFNVEMYLLMKEKEIPLQYRMRDGAHNWEYWQSALPSVLQFISAGFME